MRLLLAACVLAAASPALAQPQAPPTCEAPNYRAMDFWVGEWDAFRADTNAQVGRSSVTREENGCLIHEHWTGANGQSGQSFNIYERLTGEWEQYWVSSAGEITHYRGGPVSKGMQLTAENDRSVIAPDAVFSSRVTLLQESDGAVRQIGETSSDRQNWTTQYVIIYRRRGG